MTDAEAEAPEEADLPEIPDEADPIEGPARTEYGEEDDIPISAETFPDDLFMRYVKYYFDDGDGVLSPEEREAVRELNLHDLPIRSPEGVKYLPYLMDLNCEYCELTELDVSENEILKKLNCRHNAIAQLTVNYFLQELDCSNNALTSLAPDEGGYLLSLNCSDNALMELDIRCSDQLTTLFCSNNELTELDLSGTGSLRRLGCSGNRLTALDLSSCQSLEYLNCGRNDLTELDLSACPALDALDCYLNRITSIDLSACPILIETVQTGDREPIWHEGTDEYYISDYSNYKYWFFGYTTCCPLFPWTRVWRSFRTSIPAGRAPTCPASASPTTG